MKNELHIAAESLQACITALMPQEKSGNTAKHFAGLGCVFVLALTSFVCSAQDPAEQRNPNGLAVTPPMGWNTWNHFQLKITDAVVRAQADALVSSGMRDLGYVYVNIDDGWQGKRDANVPPQLEVEKAFVR